MSDEDYMRLAIQEARLALKEGNRPIGCVLVLNNKVVSKGHNKIYSSHNRLAHAEIIALETAKDTLFENMGKATLYTTYEPCPMCLGACIICRLKKVVFGVDLDDSGATHLKDAFPLSFSQTEFQTEFVGGILQDECEQVYREDKLNITDFQKAKLNKESNL